ncbi:MAG: DUF948 domain-containing protein [bacterium]|nr:DUF948 domain-containing protein [bacterium]
MVINISVAVIALVMLAAVAFLIPVLLQVRRTAREAEKTLEVVRQHIVPIGHDLTIISQRISDVLATVQSQVEKVDQSLTAVRDSALVFRDFEKNLFQNIQEPLGEVSALISGIVRGVASFTGLLRR